MVDCHDGTIERDLKKMTQGQAAEAGWSEVEPKKARAKRREKVLDIPATDPSWGLALALMGEESEDINTKVSRMGQLCGWYICVDRAPSTIDMLQVSPGNEDMVAQFLKISEELGYIKAHNKTRWKKGPAIKKIIHVMQVFIVLMCLSPEEKGQLEDIRNRSSDSGAFMSAFYEKYGNPNDAIAMIVARAIAKENAKEGPANDPR